MDILFCLTCQLIEEVRNTCKEHHKTVEYGIEEQHKYLCSGGLHRIGNKVRGLDILYYRPVTVKDFRCKAVGNGTDVATAVAEWAALANAG